MISEPGPMVRWRYCAQTAVVLQSTGSPVRSLLPMGFPVMSMKSLAAVVMLSAALLPAASAAFAPVPHSDDPADPMDQAIESQMAKAKIVGVGAAIIVEKRVVFTKGYGFADREHGRPFTADTLMNIGSISKTITGAALMHAVQEGKLSLDQDINGLLPFKVVNPVFPRPAHHPAAVGDPHVQHHRPRVRVRQGLPFRARFPATPRRFPRGVLCGRRGKLFEGELPGCKARNTPRILQHRCRAGGPHR